MNKKSIQKAIMPAVLLLCVLGPVAGVFGEEGITGDWEFKMTFGEREITAKVSFVQNADGTLSGTWTSRRGARELSDVKFEDGKVSFVRSFSRQDREFKMTYSGTVEGGTIKGTISSERGESPFEAVRIVGPEAVIGEWNMKLKMGERQFESKLVISKNADGSLSGQWLSDYGEHVVSDVKFENGKLTFNRKSKLGEREWESSFEGTVEGNQLKGAIKSERGEIEANGTKAGADIFGKWELTTTSERGTRTRILTINEDMTGTYQMRNRDVPVKDLKVEGNKLSFKVEMTFNERSFEIDFKAEIDGDTLKGESTTARGTREFTGKRVVAEPGE